MSESPANGAQLMTTSTKLAAVLGALDRLNADDPRTEIVAGVAMAREIAYADRMSDCLLKIYPDASETLRIAARAQHVCRWQIPRDNYPPGRVGYNAWRAAARKHHARIAADVMARHGYEPEAIAQVGKTIRKEELKSDPESQALENVVGAVFVEFYLPAFVADHADYDEAKLLAILARTLRKMDRHGIDYVLRQDLPETTRRLLSSAA